MRNWYWKGGMFCNCRLNQHVFIEASRVCGWRKCRSFSSEFISNFEKVHVFIYSTLCLNFLFPVIIDLFVFLRFFWSLSQMTSCCALLWYPFAVRHFRTEFNFLSTLASFSSVFRRRNRFSPRADVLNGHTGYSHLTLWKSSVEGQLSQFCLV